MPLLELPLLVPLSGFTSASTPSLSMPLLPLAEISGAHLIAITAIISGILLTAVIIIFGLKYAQRRQELWHETARVALEKGQPLPPLPRDMQQGKNPEDDNDIRTGLIMIAIGAGLYFFFLSFFGGWMKYLGAIPGFIGVALLLYGLFSALFGRRNPPAGRPPQS
jgi:hypothetical protein